MKRTLILSFILVSSFVCFTRVSAHSISDRIAAGQPIRILLVPGHDRQTIGAQYKDMREVDMNFTLVNKIKDLLADDPRFHITVSRTELGYAVPLQEYFNLETDDIEDFIQEHKEDTARAIEDGDIEVSEQVPHGDATSDGAYRLYGTNKWIDETGFDLALHVHFNDYGARVRGKPGAYTGFSIYVPDPQFPNFAGTETIGGAIKNQLSRIWYPSTNPAEARKVNPQGVIPDFNLIALGANRTLTTPSVLVEYGYMYQPEFSRQFYPAVSNSMARATVSALKSLARGNMELVPEDEPLVLYDWHKPLQESKIPSTDVLMLQFALRTLELYPPIGKTETDCPFTGMYGSCTKSAVKEFQKLHNLKPDGLFGLKTSALLEKELVPKPLGPSQEKS